MCIFNICANISKFCCFKKYARITKKMLFSSFKPPLTYLSSINCVSGLKFMFCGMGIQLIFFRKMRKLSLLF